jgi:hypothetical protein
MDNLGRMGGEVPFDEVLYYENDPRAKEEGRIVVPQLDPRWMLDPAFKKDEDYRKSDLHFILKAIADGCRNSKLTIEVGRRLEGSCPSFDNFPYSTVHVPSRKRHCLFDFNIDFSHSWDFCVIQSMHTIVNAGWDYKRSAKKGDQTVKHQYFMNPHASECSWFSTGNGDKEWRQIPIRYRDENSGEYVETAGKPFTGFYPCRQEALESEAGQRWLLEAKSPETIKAAVLAAKEAREAILMPWKKDNERLLEKARASYAHMIPSDDPSE